MPKGVQGGNKMVKKPKKDSGKDSGASFSDRPVAPVTSVMPKGKEKKKQG